LYFIAVPTQCLKECSSAISTQVTSRQCANKCENENIFKNVILPTQKIEDESSKEVHAVIEESIKDKYKQIIR